jgi:hypothetical protein
MPLGPIPLRDSTHAAEPKRAAIFQRHDFQKRELSLTNNQDVDDRSQIMKR